MEFGDHLRRARERRGIALREISEKTNISIRLLEALERDEFDKLPGGIFTRGFVRAYAAEVDLDPDEAVELFLQQFPRDPAEPGSPVSGHPQDHARAVAAEAGQVQRQMVSLQAVGAVAAGLLLFALLAYSAVRLIAGPEKADAEPDSGQTPAASSEPAPQNAAHVPTAPLDGVTVQRTRGADNAEVLTIDIHPEAPCWVRVAVDGRVEFAKLMEPGERITRQARQGFVIQVGDAAAFRYSLNDAPGRTLGSSGEVVTARIDRSNVRQYTLP